MNITFLLLASVGNRLDFTKSLALRYVTNKLRRCCLFLMLWKNANHSLLDSIFWSKLCKSTSVSDCPLSFLEQFLALIPRYASRTYSIEHTLSWTHSNGFKLPLGRMNFITVLNHPLHPKILCCCFSTYCHVLFTQISFCWIISEYVVEFILCKICTISFRPVRRYMIWAITVWDFLRN